VCSLYINLPLFLLILEFMLFSDRKNSLNIKCCLNIGFNLLIYVVFENSFYAIKFILTGVICYFWSQNDYSLFFMKISLIVFHFINSFLAYFYLFTFNIA